MSVLRSLEDKIAGLVEGTFGRAFRSEVRPVEIARRLAREMEEHRSVSLSRTYVPNEYAVYLSTADRERFAGFEDALAAELAGYVLEHARRERFALLSKPLITFKTDPRLGLGEFGIQARLVRPAGSAPEAGRVEQGPPGNTMIYTTADRLRQPLQERDEVPEAPVAAVAVLRMEGRRLPLGRHGAVLGRSRDCDIVLADANVSRRHAQVRPAGGSWEVADLDSTNGVKVNGRRIAEPRALQPGDRVGLGTSELTFELDS